MLRCTESHASCQYRLAAYKREHKIMLTRICASRSSSFSLFRCTASQAVQKCNQVRLFLIRKPDAEALVIENDDVAHSGGRAVMEVRRARRKRVQDWVVWTIAPVGLFCNVITGK